MTTRLRLLTAVAAAAVLGCGAAAAPAASASGAFSLVVEPDQGIAPIQSLIGSAQHTLDMTMYELEDQQSERLLEDAAARGVAVRVILDHSFSGTHNDAASSELSSHGVSVHWAPSTYAITHQKTITVDGSVAAVMTLNLTSQYYRTSRDVAVLDHDPADLRAIESVFDADFASKQVGTPAGDDLVWSPGQSASALPALIRSAQHSLLVENEEMADPDITQALAAAARRGVDVEVCMTDDPKWHSAFDTLTAAGAHVATYAQSASLYIHAKVIDVDDGSAGARVFAGSENFSRSSLERNRELGVVLTASDIVDAIARMVRGDVQGGAPWS